MSAGNLQYELARAYEMNKKVMTATGTFRTGLDSDFFMIDNPIIIEDPAANTTVTVPSGAYPGQEVYLVTKSNSDSKTITISVTLHYTSDPETFTMNSEGNNLMLRWDGERWGTIGGTATAT